MDQEDFVTAVRQWLSFDTELNLLQKQAKELRTQKKELGMLVMQEMEKQNLTLLDTGSTHLRIAKSNKKQPLTRKFVEAQLAQLFGQGTEAYKAAEDSLIKNRPVKEHKELKAKITKQ